MAKKERLLMAQESADGEAFIDQPEPEKLSADCYGPEAVDLSILVKRAQFGDHSAFEALVLRFQTPVRLYLAHLIGDEEQARDLTQDTFYQAWKGLPKLRDPFFFRAWLFRVATNRGHSWLRHHRLIGWVSLDWLNGSSEDSQSRWENASIAGEVLHAPESGFEERLAEAETLRQALLQVPVDYRSCLLLHLSLGFSVPEVAEQLGLTRGAVRMRLFRGLALLRKAHQQQSGSGEND
jgi:RNA polymerase sigma-70 factor (ECF subfamily)